MAYGIKVEYLMEAGATNPRCVMEAIGGDRLCVLDLLQVAYDLLRVSILKSDDAPVPEPKKILNELLEHLVEVGSILHDKYKLDISIEYKLPLMDAANDVTN